MDFRIFSLPTEDDDRNLIESRWCELNTRRRNGEKLDEVEINWMDTANNWLSVSEST